MSVQSLPLISSTLSKFIWHFVRLYKPQVAILSTCAAVAGCCGTINSYLTKVIIDIIDNPPTNNPLIQLTILPVILLIINLESHKLLWRAINYINLKIAPEIKNNIIKQVFTYTHNHSAKFFQENFAGTIASNIARIADHTEIIIHDCLPFILRSFVQLVIALGSMYLIDPKFSIALSTWTLLFIIISIVFSNKINLLSDSYAESQSVLAGKITDSVTSASNVKLFARENFEVKYLGQYFKTTVERYRRKEWFLIKFWCVQGVSITILTGIMLFTLITLRTQGKVTIGDFAFIIGLTMYVTDNVWSLTEYIDKINDAIGQCKQSLKMLLVPLEMSDNTGAAKLQVSSGNIIFKDASFSYAKTNPIFSNISLTIPSYQKIGIVGQSGSGKTTFTNLIIRLLDLDSGYITIDGQDISKVELKSLRNNISFIPQDPILFHRTLMENIRYGEIEASDQEVIQAAKLAHAHEFINQMPQGYDSLVGERGVKLSNGQRQRIAIARAILKNAPILIMDEATSALDSITENYIQESLKCIMHNRTLIVIAHRLSTLLSMDRILVFEQGRIVEDGTHQELLNKNGLYKIIWSYQVDGYLIDKI